MATDVQFICSENFNAPSLGNAHGALIGVLDVLVNGLLLPPLVSASANGTQVTLQFSQNHLLKMFQMIELFLTVRGRVLFLQELGNSSYTY